MYWIWMLSVFQVNFQWRGLCYGKLLQTVPYRDNREMYINLFRMDSMYIFSTHLLLIHFLCAKLCQMPFKFPNLVNILCSFRQFWACSGSFLQVPFSPPHFGFKISIFLSNLFLLSQYWLLSLQNSFWMTVLI